MLSSVITRYEGSCFSPRDFKDPEEPDAAEHGDAERRHDLQLHEDRLHDASAHYEAVEAVEERHKVCLEPQTVHFDQHLTCEQG